MAGRRRREGRGVGGIQEKLRACVEAGDHYEALQMYRAVVARKYNGGDFETAFDLVSTGAATLLGASLVKETLDLVEMLVNLVDKSREEHVQKMTNVVLRVAAKVPPSADQLVLARLAIPFAKSQAELRSAHGLAATALCATAEHAKAFPHFVAAHLPEDHAALMGPVADAWEYPLERLVARETLRYAAASQPALARRFLAAASAPAPRLSATEVVRAAVAVVGAVEKRSASAFEEARSSHGHVFQSDEDLATLVGRIARHVFGIRPAMNPMMSMMQAMLGGQPTPAPAATSAPVSAPVPALASAPVHAPVPAPAAEPSADDLDDMLDDIDL